MHGLTHSIFTAADDDGETISNLTVLSLSVVTSR